MQYRIGINPGDVIYDESRIYGDGINVAVACKASQSREDLHFDVLIMAPPTGYCWHPSDNLAGRQSVKR